MKPKRQQRDIQVAQGSLDFINRSSKSVTRSEFIAQVTAVYADRMTCDVVTLDNTTIYNIPVMVKGGIIDGGVYGEVDLPAANDYVIVGYAGYGVRHKMILGTVIPYLSNDFLKDPVNSGSKAYVDAFLEKNAEDVYKKIFKSGTTLHVEADGSFTVETPSGTYFRIDENTKKVTISDQNGNTLVMGSSSVTINDNFEVLQ